MKCKELFDRTYNDAKQYCDDPDDTLESAKSQLLNIDYLRFIDADNDLDKAPVVYDCLDFAKNSGEGFYLIEVVKNTIDKYHTATAHFFEDLDDLVRYCNSIKVFAHECKTVDELKPLLNGKQNFKKVPTHYEILNSKQEVIDSIFKFNDEHEDNIINMLVF